MFKSGGYNVYPREVELSLEQHPAVALAVVVSVPDPLFDEVGWAYLLLKAGAGVTAEELQAWCKGQLVNYKVPKRFIFREALPLLPVGKVDKLALRREATSSLQLSEAP